MKLTAFIEVSCVRPSRRCAFTLPEVMVTMAISLMVMAGVLSCHLFGMRLFEVTKAKLGASDEARAAVGLMSFEIRSAKMIRIGDGSMTTFSEVSPNRPQSGNAIQVYPTTDTNQYVRYFHDATNNELKRTTNGWSNASIIAHSVSNHVVFSSEDFRGNTLTNNENNRVIGVALNFYQLQYPSVPIGPGNFYDYYQLRTRITRRALE